MKEVMGMPGVGLEIVHLHRRRKVMVGRSFITFSLNHSPHFG